jgi:hypothetical protein
VGTGVASLEVDAEEEADPLGHEMTAEESYQDKLRRRARELNQEIHKFKVRESAATKQRQLRQTAAQLNSELAALKQARQHAGSLPVGGRGGGEAHARCPRHTEFRIAMLMPWVSSPTDRHRLPEWLPFLVTTASHSAMLVDWLVFHEGPLGSQQLQSRPSNVRFFDMGAPGGIASLFAREMSGALRLPAINASTISTRMRYMFQKWPRLVAEYKPAFGSIFRE